jgi:PadR family transcriptional regulator, regulatory protein AphA
MSTDLTKTSYAILGLLGIRPWTTYELAQQMERSLKNFWPRAQSSVYEEPKRLVRAGLAKATKDAVGRRPRTTYSITPKGKRTLARWLAERGDGQPNLECEALLKVFYGEQSTKTDVLANIAAMADWARAQTEQNIEMARLYRDEPAPPFPERVAVITLTGKFMTDFADMVAAWAQWATETVAPWPDDPADAPAARDVLDAVAARYRRQ